MRATLFAIIFPLAFAASCIRAGFGEHDAASPDVISSTDQARPDVPSLPRSCQDVTASADGVYLIDPDQAGGVAPYQVYCKQTLQGGGWTLVMTSSDDGKTTWTSNNRLIFSTDKTLVGSLLAPHKDFKSPAHHQLLFHDLLFVHQPSGITAEYAGIGDGTSDLGNFIAAIPFPNCGYNMQGNGFPQTGGTLKKGGQLCDTDLYFNLGDHETGDITDCQALGSGTNSATYGPCWNGHNNNSCPFDDPHNFGLGPSGKGGCHGPDDECAARGFGWALVPRLREPR